jgi:hypothetical protein
MAATVVADYRTYIFRNAGQIGKELFGGLLAEVRVLFNRAVEVGDVGLVMLVVVQLHGRFVDGGLEGGVVVWEGRKFEGHGGSPVRAKGFAVGEIVRALYWMQDKDNG